MISHQIHNRLIEKISIFVVESARDGPKVRRKTASKTKNKTKISYKEHGKNMEMVWQE